MSGAAPLARNSHLALLFCSLAALLEGFDNQSMGVAAPKLIPEFGLSPGHASIIFSAATFGLFVGAAVGGRAADRFGRRPTLALSMLLFGLFSLLTAQASGAETLFIARLLTGLGLGGAMPNFIALASEAVPESRRLSTVTVVMAGMPLGGLCAGLIALGESVGWGWRTIFYLGGGAPILIALLMWWCWPEPGTGRPAPSAAAAGHAPVRLQGIGRVLFGEGRRLTTLELWGGFFFTQMVLLLMLNWLPSLFVGLGFSHPQASLASMCFNLCGAASSLVLGRLHGGGRRKLWVALTYTGMALALAMLPLSAHHFALALAACAVAGVFIIGAQLVLFALAPLYYQRLIRGTGVGSAVAIGRLGSVLGPLYAGLLLSSGGGSAAVLLGIVPAVVVGGASALALTFRPRCID